MKAHFLAILIILPLQTGSPVPSATHPKTQRLISQKWRAAAASVHSAGRTNSRHLLRPASAPPLTLLCPSATTSPPPFPSTTTAGLYTAYRGESTSRSKGINQPRERKRFRRAAVRACHTGVPPLLYFLLQSRRVQLPQQKSDRLLSNKTKLKKKQHGAEGELKPPPNPSEHRGPFHLFTAPERCNRITNARRYKETAI